MGNFKALPITELRLRGSFHQKSEVEIIFMERAAAVIIALIFRNLNAMRKLLHICLLIIAVAIPALSNADVAQNDLLKTAQIRGSAEHSSHYLFPPKAAAFYGIQNHSENGVHNQNQIPRSDSNQHEEGFSFRSDDGFHYSKVNIANTGIADEQNSAWYIKKLIYPFHSYL